MSGFQVGDKVIRIDSRGLWKAKCTRFSCDPNGIFTVAKIEYYDGKPVFLWIKELCPDLKNNMDTWGANKFQLAPIDLDEDDDECI